MKWRKRSIIEFGAVLGMAGVVCTLAVLQYRWTAQISQSEQQRLKGTVSTGVRGFTQEFSYDFERLCEGFEIDPEVPPSNLESFVARQQVDWLRIASRPALLQAVYLWKTQAVHSSFELLEPGGRRFIETPWPEPLAGLHQYLDQQAQRLNARRIEDRQALYYPWMFYGDQVALARPLFQLEAPGEIQLQGFLILALNKDFLQQQYLPDLVLRHFGEPALANFGIAVRSANAPGAPVYVSGAGFAASNTAPDARVNLFDSISEEARRRGNAPVQVPAEGQQWQLVVQDLSGSVDVGVAQWRRRNLAVSFGLLAVLAGTMVLLFSVARRAERLARLQMEFVAGVSHELCTPLAVINSAAENIIDGVVDTPAQVQEYGNMIRDHGRRLERMVDEVLLFAAGRFGKMGYDLRPIEITPILDQTLARSETILRDAGFTLEKEIPPELPFVVADTEALSKCVENLISNAMKYSGEKRWIRVRASSARNGNTPEVRISVEDKGIGIPPADLAHVFEPFYRAQNVREGQVRGVGLGLHLVKRMMEAMNGGVTVSSKPSHGSVFTLHFSAFDFAEPRHDAAPKPEVAKA